MLDDTEKITIRLPKKFLRALDFLVEVDGGTLFTVVEQNTDATSGDATRSRLTCSSLACGFWIICSRMI